MKYHKNFEDLPPYYEPLVERKFIPKATAKELKDFRQVFEGPMVSEDFLLEESENGVTNKKLRFVKIPKAWRIDSSSNDQNCSFNSEAFFGSSSSSGSTLKNEQDIFDEYNASIKYGRLFTEFKIIHEASGTDFNVPLLKAISQSDTIRLMVEFSGDSIMQEEEADDQHKKIKEKNCKITIPIEVAERVETIRSLVIYMFTGLLVDPKSMPLICSDGEELISGKEIGIANMPIKLSFDVSELYETAQFLQMKKLMDQIASRCVRVYINMPDVRYKATSGKQKAMFLAGIIHIAQERNDMKMMEEAIISSRDLNDVFNPLLEMPARFSKQTWDKMLSIGGGLHNKFMFSPCSFMVYMIQFDVKLEDMDALIKKFRDYSFNQSNSKNITIISTTTTTTTTTTNDNNNDNDSSSSSSRIIAQTTDDEITSSFRCFDPFSGMTRPSVMRRAISTFAKLMKPSDHDQSTAGPLDGDVRYSMMRMTIAFDFYIIATMMNDNVMYKGCSPLWLKGMVSEVLNMEELMSLRDVPSTVLSRMKAFALQPFKKKNQSMNNNNDTNDSMDLLNQVNQQVDLIALSLRTDMIFSYYSRNAASGGGCMKASCKDTKYEDVPSSRFFSTRAIEAIYKGMQMQVEANKLHLSLRKSSYCTNGNKRRRTNNQVDDGEANNNSSDEEEE